MRWREVASREALANGPKVKGRGSNEGICDLVKLSLGSQEIVKRGHLKKTRSFCSYPEWNLN